MIRLLFFILGIAAANATAVEAMPFTREQTGLVIPVAAGCGLGVNRAFYAGCYPIYPPGSGAYYNPYFVGYYDPFYYLGYPRAYYRGPSQHYIYRRAYPH
jgi:hypothetical protein